MRPWVRGGGMLHVPPPLWCRLTFPVAACVGGLSPSLLGVRWPVGGVRWAGVALSHGCGRVFSPSGLCGGLLGLDPMSVSLVFVLWCALVRRAVSCRVSPCCAVLVCAVLWCALLCCAVPRRVVAWCVVPLRGWLRRAVPRCAASCCGVSCRGVPCCGDLRGSALQCGVPCRFVLCRVLLCRGVWWALFRCDSGVGWVRRWLDWPASWCGTRAKVMSLAGGWGARFGVAWLVGSVHRGPGVPLRFVG